MVRRCLPLWLLAICCLFAGSGCCCMPCLRLPCIESLDRHYPGSDDCLNGGPCGDPEDVGGMQTGMSNCQTCATRCHGGGCNSCGGGFPWSKLTGGGCGRFYWDEWWSDPPCKCEPCDMQGNYVGPNICRTWRLGIPLPMLCRGGCCTTGCGGSQLSCWAKNRKCYDGCVLGCPGGSCRSGGCSSGTCGAGGCSSGKCHINSLGYDQKCDHCHGNQPMMPATEMQQPMYQETVVPQQPTPAPAPAVAPQARRAAPAKMMANRGAPQVATQRVAMQQGQPQRVVARPATAARNVSAQRQVR